MASALAAKAIFSRAILLNQGLRGKQFVRFAAYWNKDWKPGPYPKTEAERIAAAKKYGLLPQDYEPYPDDGTGYGDYPKLPVISTDMKDPYYEWDYPDQKRNFGEPLQVDYDMYTEERITNARTRYSMKEMLGSFLVCISFFAAIYLFAEYNGFRMNWTLAPKQYPEPGKKHYTFDPVD